MKSGNLSFSGIDKGFSGVPVLKGIAGDIPPGTFVAIAGENGAGKSTLLKIIAGLVVPDEGEVRRAGELLPPSTIVAREHGIAIVPQELEPLEELTLYENLFLGNEKARLGVLNRADMARRADELFAAFDLDLDPKRKASSLSVGGMQLLEIMKAVASGADFLLLDEPTSSLSEQEVEHLAVVLERLRGDGIGALFTTHKMPEIRRLADRVIVLRDGILTLDEDISDIEDEGIVSAMIGRKLGSMFEAASEPRESMVLEVKDVPPKPGIPGVSLSVREGEIVGLAGLVGAGRTEFIETLFGARLRTGGEVRVDGQVVPSNSVPKAVGASMALIPEERKSAGLVLGRSVSDNASLASLSRMSIGGFMRERMRSQIVGKTMERLRLKYRGQNQSTETLSGGNQQKVVIGRWLIAGSRVLLLDEPTRGVDVGARAEIYKIVRELSAGGAAIVMASSDMSEIIGLSHRVVVFSEGAISGELSRADLDMENAQERIFELASAFVDEEEFEAL